MGGAFLMALLNQYATMDNRNYNDKIRREQNIFNKYEAQRAREWNQQMDSTKYARTVTDMQSAGVNPALAMNGGVSTQATSNAQAQGANVATPELDLSQVAALAMQSRQLQLQEKLIDSEARKNNADAKKTETETTWVDKLSSAQVENLKATASKAISDITVNDSTIEVNGVKIDLYNAQTGLFDAQMDKAQKEAQLTEVQTAIANLDKQKLEQLLPYVKAYQEAGLRLQNAQTEELKQKALAEYTQASLNLSNAAVSDHIVSSEYYERLGGKIDAETGKIKETTDLVKQQIKTEEWNTKQAKRNYKWTGVNNAINATCKVATTACVVAGTVVTGGVGGALVKPTGDLQSVGVPTKVSSTTFDPSTIYTGSGSYKTHW